jgi:Histone acetyltransferase
LKHANVAIFVPHNGCPHQCSFCNQRSITGRTVQPGPQEVVSAVRTAIKSLGEETRHAEIAFFGGSFTAIEHGYMISLLSAASPYVKDGTFSGIRVSTRPDAIDDEVLTVLKEYGVTAIEFGAQSMDDRVLELNRRGHTARQVEQASELIKARGFTLGLQMMTGLYGDTPEGAVATAERLAALCPQTVRIYPTIIMRGTELGEKYLAGGFETLSLEATVRLCADLLDYFEKENIAVIRLGLHSTPELERDMLSGPWHPAFRQLCESRRMLLKISRALTENHTPKGRIMIAVHPKNSSTVIGQQRTGLAELRRMGYEAEIVPDGSLELSGFQIISRGGTKPCC